MSILDVSVLPCRLEPMHRLLSLGAPTLTFKCQSHGLSVWMRLPAPVTSNVVETLPEYQAEHYWALWQYPEGRYAYMIGWKREGWLIVMDSEQAGRSYLLTDARMNRRSPDLYRLDELTLPEAFAAVRAQQVPFVSSQGALVRTVLGVQVRTIGLLGTRAVRNIPM